MSKPYIRLDKDRAAVLLVDHQTGLLSLVRDFGPDQFNMLAMAELAHDFKLPTILSTSFEQGPNDPLVPELTQKFPEAREVHSAPRRDQRVGQRGFVKAVKATERNPLIITRLVTEVCVAFPALWAIEEGFEAFLVTDAPGTFNEVTRQAAWIRMSQAGVQLMT
jgi:nicotinamidase-related amidase